MTNYQLQVRRGANDTLQNLPSDDRERITDTLTEVSEYEQPTEHSKCNVLNNNHKEILYKIRVGDYRVLAKLEKPNLNILKIGRRSKFYNDIDGIYNGM